MITQLNEIQPASLADGYAALFAGKEPDLLFRALQDVESPGEAMGKFHSLWANDKERVLAYGELAVAS